MRQMPIVKERLRHDVKVVPRVDEPAEELPVFKAEAGDLAESSELLKHLARMMKLVSPNTLVRKPASRQGPTA